MFTFRRFAVMFDADPGGGGGEAPPAAPAGDSAGAPAAPAPSPADPGAPAPTGDPAPAPEPVDYGAKVTEWGGEEAVTRALKVDQALSTTEGQEALMVTHLRNRGYDNAAIEAFLHPPTPEPQGETVEQLLADPERVLTAGEIARVLEHNAQQSQQAQQAQAAATAIRNTIDATCASLGVADADRAVVLTLADQFLPTPGNAPNDPTVVDAAIRRGHAEYQNRIAAAAQAALENKGAAHQGIPSPLPAGGGPGGEQPGEPQSIAEAGERVRKAVLGR